MAPRGAQWQAALAHWRTLASDGDAHWDKVVPLDLGSIEPQASWGTSPGQTLPISASLPDPASISNPAQRRELEKALAYMGLTAGQSLEGVPITHVFIGSCTNGRIEDLRAAAEIAQGRKVSPGIKAIVVPGSAATRAQAEAEGLDGIFREAGFEWRFAGCSMCVAMNDDRLAPGDRCASTSNRNFEGRQGPGGRTHLMSPASAAASAIAGCLADVREFAR